MNEIQQIEQLLNQSPPSFQSSPSSSSSQSPQDYHHLPGPTENVSLDWDPSQSFDLELDSILNSQLNDSPLQNNSTDITPTFNTTSTIPDIPIGFIPLTPATFMPIPSNISSSPSITPLNDTLEHTHNSNLNSPIFDFIASPNSTTDTSTLLPASITPKSINQCIQLFI